MSARQHAEKRLEGETDGSDWAKVDALKGIGWALLHLADVIAAAYTPGAQPPPPPPPPSGLPNPGHRSRTP